MHEQLWRFDNINLLSPLLASTGLDTDTPGGWNLLMVEMLIIVMHV